MALLQIGIACGRNSGPYVAHLKQTCAITRSYDHDLVYILEPSSGVTSYEHGRTLDRILSRMEPTGYGMFVDCDVAFLARHWDRTLTRAIRGDVVAIGSQWIGPKYQTFPSVVCMLFDVRALRSLGGLSMRPGSVSQSAPWDVVTEAMSPLVGLCAGERIQQDTGYQLPIKCIPAGYTGVVMPAVRAGDPRALFIEDGVHGEEYQHDGVPIATHVGRSSVRDFAHPYTIRWREAVAKYLEAK